MGDGFDVREREGWAVSRRHLFGTAGAAGAAGLAALAGCGTDRRDEHPARVSAPAPEGVLGANFNGDPSGLSFAQLRDVRATWMRGFFAMPDARKGRPADQPAIRTLLTAAARGYGTVLSLKFPFSRRPLPAGSAMAAELARLDTVLSAVLNRVDILVIGNEPFIETRRADQDDDRLNAFYEHVARHVIDFRAKHYGDRCRTRLYMGALNHLDRPAARTPAVERWMRFVRATPAIAGVDIHPHASAPGAVQRYLDYVLPRMRRDQRFLATEFSLVHLWQQHLGDPVPAAFADRYATPRLMPVWRFIKNAIERPVTQRKWNDFLAAAPWFQAHRNFLHDQVQRFRDTGRLAVATSLLCQGPAMVHGFDGLHATPWLLNSVFCPFTVRTAPGGLPGRNRAWARQFRALQPR